MFYEGRVRFFHDSSVYNFRFLHFTRVFEGRFSNSRSLRTGEPRATGRETTRTERVLCHMVIRTLNARRMFREIQCFINDPGGKTLNIFGSSGSGCRRGGSSGSNNK